MLRLIAVICAAIALLASSALSQAPAPGGQAPATGGQALKDAGAVVIAHRNAKTRLERMRDPNTVIPDESVDRSRTIRLGGTTLELTYVGLNHSDSTLLMRLPAERIIFAVDFLNG